MAGADVELIRRSNERWNELVVEADVSGLQEYVDEFYAPDAWIDFGSRTPDALPDHGTHVIVDWATDLFARLRDSDNEFHYEYDDPVETDGGIVVNGRSRGRFKGMDLTTHMTCLFRVRGGKIVWMSMHATPEEAQAAAAAGPPDLLG